MSSSDSYLSQYTELEIRSGILSVLHGAPEPPCFCGSCGECEEQERKIIENEKRELYKSMQYKRVAKIIAGLESNKAIKLATIQLVRKDGLEYAIAKYMAKEELPGHYATIIKDRNCIEIIVDGLLQKVCNIKIDRSLNEEILNINNLLINNSNRITAYDRVSILQKFIHCSVEKYLGLGAASVIPIIPMKNTLSAARLNLSIFDVIDRKLGYIIYIEELSKISLQLEYDEPRVSTAPYNKRTWPRWRVRHLRPISYYLPKNRRVLLGALASLDEKMSPQKFIDSVLKLYSDVL